MESGIAGKPDSRDSGVGASGQAVPSLEESEPEAQQRGLQQEESEIDRHQETGGRRESAHGTMDRGTFAVLIDTTSPSYWCEQTWGTLRGTRFANRHGIRSRLPTSVTSPSWFMTSVIRLTGRHGIRVSWRRDGPSIWRMATATSTRIPVPSSRGTPSASFPNAWQPVGDKHPFYERKSRTELGKTHDFSLMCSWFDNKDQEEEHRSLITGTAMLHDAVQIGIPDLCILWLNIFHSCFTTMFASVREL